MSTTATASRARTRPANRVTQAHVVLSEWTKLRSLRSTVYSELAAAVIIVGLSILVPLVTVNHWPPPAGDAARFDPTSRSLAGVFLAQLAVGVLGVLFITGEYATGMIRASLAAVPTRLPMLWAKAMVFAAVTFALMAPTAVVAFLIGQSILHSKHLDTTLSSPGVLRAVIGAALYLTVVGLMGLALGALVRNTAGGISALFGLLFVVPIILRFLPSSWAEPIDKYLPSTLGAGIMQVHPSPTTLAPWTGFALLCGYTAVLMAAAAIGLRRRDA